MSGYDITEGRASEAIAVDLGITAGTIWQNSGIDYDVAIGGIPFILDASDQHAYERSTAPFRKNQFDTQRDPGEQSITGWWLRSQSSFHAGQGVTFYDPFANPFSTTLASNSYRYNISYGVNVFNQGQVTLLNSTSLCTSTTAATHLEAYHATGDGDYVIMLDTNIYKVAANGTKTTLVSPSSTVYSFTTDGSYCYYIDGTSVKSVPLAGGSPTTLYSVPAVTTSSAMHWAKQRLVAGINNALYELPAVSSGSATSFTITATQNDATTNTATIVTSTNHTISVNDHITISSVGTNGSVYNGNYMVMGVPAPNSFTVFNTGTNLAYATNTGTVTVNSNYPVYTHPNPNWIWTDIEEAGPAIYAAGYSGVNSAIYMFVLTTQGTMPVLTSGIVAAQLPQGEVIYSMYSHLGEYLIIGTNKGARVAQVDQATGYITYGPLLVYTTTPVRGFAARDSYVWFGSAVSDGTDTYAGTWRIDLSNEIDTLRFATTQDVVADNLPGTTYDIAFLGNTNQLTFLASTDAGTPASQGLWIQSATQLMTDGFVQTGYIRYNTLEQKNFKRVVARGDYGIAPSGTTAGVTKGSMSIYTVDTAGNQYNIVSYNNVIGTPEVTITSPSGAQDAIALRFTLYRDATDPTTGPTFKGYQLKAVPATPRTRIIKIPLLCYDVETDKYNGTIGYEGRAFDKLAALESLEAAGDVVTLQDFRTGETSQCLIEELTFVNKMSPDKKLTNFGGVVVITVRTV